MSQNFALLVAADTCPGVPVPRAPYAEAGAAALAEVLRRYLTPPPDVTLLAGAHATKTAVESRLRQLRKRVQPGDVVYLFWAGRVFAEAGQNYLLGADAQADDLPDTAVPLADLLDALAASPCERFFVFLDAGTAGEGFSLAAEELEEFAKTSEKGVCFTSGIGEEPSHADESRQRGVWAHLLAEAFAGRAKAAQARPGVLTVGSLQAYLEQELPRELRKVLTEPAAQTPGCFGGLPGGAEVARVTGRGAEVAPAAPPVDLSQLRRAVLRAEAAQRVKSLGGFQKGHRLPDAVTPSAEKFVARIAQEDVRADIDEIYNALREELGFKRKDLEASAEADGTGFIRTPAFDYTVSVRLDPQDPATVLWRREVGQIRDPELIRGPRFQAVFGDVFDRLVFEFAAPLDVIAFVDQMEERDAPGTRVRVASDGSYCEVTLAGFPGAVRIDANTLQIERGPAGSPGGLIDRFFEFLRRFEPGTGLKALPLGKGD